MSVFCVKVKLAFSNCSANDMVERAGCVYACFAWHVYQITHQNDDIKLISKERPLTKIVSFLDLTLAGIQHMELNDTY
jgi:hypothetical protein